MNKVLPRPFLLNFKMLGERLFFRTKQGILNVKRNIVNFVEFSCRDEINVAALFFFDI